MIKLTFCLRRRPDLSREAFFDYWLNRHAPLVRRHQAALRMRRYVQLHGRELKLAEGMTAARGAPVPYDGVAELWYDSIDDLKAMAADPAAHRAGRELLEDERNFIDHANSPLWFGDEHVIFS